SGFNFCIFSSFATTDRIAFLTSFSAAITELQLKLTHDLNVIVLSHPNLFADWSCRFLQEKTKLYREIPDVLLKRNEN
ncbi:MAG: hypothetical protein ACRCVV_09175, partial [Shewanella sp.]